MPSSPSRPRGAPVGNLNALKHGFYSGGANFAPPSQRHGPKAPPLGQDSLTKHTRGAPPGNLNALKHGFYSRRLKKRDLDGVDAADVKGLVEEIALIRVFTRRLIESVHPDMDPFELAFILRALCLASSTITRVVKTQFLIASSGSAMDDLIDQAILEVNQELHSKLLPPDEAAPSSVPDPHTIPTEA
jgi:hypothetical protein